MEFRGVYIPVLGFFVVVAVVVFLYSSFKKVYCLLFAIKRAILSIKKFIFENKVDKIKKTMGFSFTCIISLAIKKIQPTIKTNLKKNPLGFYTF